MSEAKQAGGGPGQEPSGGSAVAVPAGGWLPEIEALKALAILAVVMVHAGRPWWHPERSQLERWVELLTMAGVPCFLFCSGFLQAAGGPVGWALTRRRLGRLLAPYLLASVLAQLFRRYVLGQPVAAPLEELLIADAFGAYYYVFVIVTLTLCVPVFSRLPRAMLWPLVIFFVCTGAVRSLAQWMPEIERELLARGRAAPGDFRLAVRHPLLTWGYFLVGYALRREWPRFIRWLEPRRLRLRAWLVATTVAAFTLLAFADLQRWQFVSYALVYLVLATLVVSWFGELQRVEPSVSYVASHTYLIYLYHLFFLLGAQRLWPQPRHGFSLALYVLHVGAGLGGALALAWLARRTLSAPLLAWLGASPARADA